MSSKWKNFKLSEFCTKIGSGATPTGGKSSYSDDGEIALIRSQNVLDFVFSYDGLAYINSKQAKKLSNVEIEIDDVLINITGDSVARVCKVPENIIPARVNQHVSILRVDKSKFSSELLKYLLLVQENKNRLLSLSSSGATRNALTKTMLENFEVFAPEDIDEQQEIADILKSLDDKIANNNHINQTLEEIAQALFKSWFVDFEPIKAKIQAKTEGADPHLAAMMAISGKTEEEIHLFPVKNQKELAKIADLFPNDIEETDLGLIPEGWGIKKIGDIYNTSSGGTPSRTNNSFYENGEVLWVKSKELSNTFIFDTEERITHEAVKKSSAKIIEPFSLLIAMYGATVGQMTILSEGATCNQAICAVSKKAVYDYSYLYLYFQEYKENLMNMASGSAQQNISQIIIKNFEILVPDKKLASEFQKKVHHLFIEILHNSKENVNLSNIRNNLLPKLLNGEIKLDGGYGI